MGHADPFPKTELYASRAVRARCARFVDAQPRSDSERIARLSFSKDGRRLSLAGARGDRPFYRRGHILAPIGRGVAGCIAPRAPALRDLQAQAVVREQGANFIEKLGPVAKSKVLGAVREVAVMLFRLLRDHRPSHGWNFDRSRRDAVTVHFTQKA